MGEHNEYVYKQLPGFSAVEYSAWSRPVTFRWTSKRRYREFGSDLRARQRRKWWRRREFVARARGTGQRRRCGQLARRPAWKWRRWRNGEWSDGRERWRHRNRCGSVRWDGSGLDRRWRGNAWERRRRWSTASRTCRPGAVREEVPGGNPDGRARRAGSWRGSGSSLRGSGRDCLCPGWRCVVGSHSWRNGRGGGRGFGAAAARATVGSSRGRQHAHAKNHRTLQRVPRRGSAAGVTL